MDFAATCRGDRKVQKLCGRLIRDAPSIPLMMRFAVNGTLVLGLAPQLLRRNYVKLVQKLPLIELQLKS